MNRKGLVLPMVWWALAGMIFFSAAAATPSSHRFSALAQPNSTPDLLALLPYWSQAPENADFPDDDGDLRITVLDLISRHHNLAKSPGLVGRYTSFQDDTVRAVAGFNSLGLKADVVKVAPKLDQLQNPNQEQQSLLDSGMHRLFHASYTGLLYVPERARYTFILAYGDAMRLSLDGEPLIHFDGPEGFAEAAVDLEEGFLPIQIDYQKGSQGSPSILFAWRSNGRVIGPNNAVVAETYLWHRRDEQVADDWKRGGLDVAFEPASHTRVETSNPTVTARFYAVAPQFQFWIEGKQVPVVNGKCQLELALEPGLNRFPWKAQSGSLVKEGTFTLYHDDGAVGEPGLAAMVYPAELLGAGDVHPDVPPSQVAVARHLDLAPDATASLQGIRLEAEQTLWLRGRIWIEHSGEYTFFLNTTTESRFWLNGAVFLKHTDPRLRRMTWLTRGYHDIALAVSDPDDVPSTTLLWQPPGRQTAGNIPSHLLSRKSSHWIPAADFTWNSADPERVGGDLIAAYFFLPETPQADSGEAGIDLPQHPRWRPLPDGGMAVPTPSHLRSRTLGTHFLTQATTQRAFTVEWDWTYALSEQAHQQFYRINYRRSTDHVLIGGARNHRFVFWFMGRTFEIPVDLSPGTRYHATVQWDGDWLRTFLNGHMKTKVRFDATGFDQNLPRNLDFQIGDDRGFPFFGEIHGLSLYARALDPAEVETNYLAAHDTIRRPRQPVSPSFDAIIPAGTTAAELEQALHVLNRAAFGPTPETLRDALTMGVEAWLTAQLEPETIFLPQAVTDLENVYQPQQRMENLQAWLTGRMVHSPRQLEEVLAWFWENHFHTDLRKTGDAAAEFAENQRFRGLAFATFGELLATSARNAPMIQYLDGNTNLAGAPNENYAREILELHSFGEDNGYTYEDIVAAARIFTGWTQYEGRFHFEPGHHDYGVKELLGLRFDQRDGQDEGLQLIDHLATAPETAQFISTKLCRLFIDDNPPPAVVTAAKKRFLETEGDIREVVRTILFHDSFLNDPDYRTQKLKTPLEFVVSMQRAVGAEDEQHSYRAGLKQLGMPLFDFPYPTGYAEQATPWRDTNAVYYRWQLINQMCTNRRWATQPTLDVARISSRYGLTDAATTLDFLEVLVGFQPEQRAKLGHFLRSWETQEDTDAQPATSHHPLAWALNAALRGASFQHQ